MEDGIILNRVCNVCFENKIIDNFLFHSGDKKYSPKCKDCTNLERRIRKKFKLRRVYQTERDKQVGYKICSKCHTKKDLNGFYLASHGGFDTRCKECVKLKNKINIAKNPQLHKVRRNLLISTPQYKKRRLLKEKERRKNNPILGIISTLRKRTRNILNGERKSAKTLQLLGCSINYFKEWLQSKFYPQVLPNAIRMMTFDNYGQYGWHIDHIIPCTKFDLSNPEEQRKCFHYTNLQPLWREDNLIKGNRTSNVQLINK